MSETIVTSHMLTKGKEALGDKASALSDDGLYRAYRAMTQARLGSEIVPDFESVVYCDDLRQECARLIRERYDFDIESDRIRYLEETLLASNFALFDEDAETFENPFRDLPPGAMYKLVTTFLERTEPLRQQSRLICEALVRQYGRGRSTEEGNPLLQGYRNLGKTN